MSTAIFEGICGRQALDLELTGDEVEQAALVLHPDRGALELDVHLDLDELVQGHLEEVGVEQLSP